MAPLATRPVPKRQEAPRAPGVPVIEFDDVSKVYPGGHVGLESDTGRGARFWLDLPAQATAPRP